MAAATAAASSTECDRAVAAGDDRHTDLARPAPAPRSLSPNRASASGDGPTNVRPAAAQAEANAAFSARNP